MNLKSSNIFMALKSLLKPTVVKKTITAQRKSNREEKISFLIDELEFEVNGLSEVHNAFGELERIKRIVRELKDLKLNNNL